MHSNFQLASRATDWPRQNQEPRLVESRGWCIIEEVIEVDKVDIGCSRKIRQIKEGWAEQCHTHTFYFANLPGFTRPSAWVPCFFIFKYCGEKNPVQILKILILQKSPLFGQRRCPDYTENCQKAAILQGVWKKWDLFYDQYQIKKTSCWIYIWF